MSLKDPNSAEWKILYGVTGTIDVIQWAADLTGVGAGVSEVADPFIGIGLGVWFQVRGASLTKQPRRLVSLVASDVAEQLSVQVLPAWILDALYIHKTIKEEWAIEQAALAAQEENGPANRMVGDKMMRVPPKSTPKYENGRGNIRPLPETKTLGQNQKNEEIGFSA